MVRFSQFRHLLYNGLIVFTLSLFRHINVVRWAMVFFVSIVVVKHLESVLETVVLNSCFRDLWLRYRHVTRFHFPQCIYEIIFCFFIPFFKLLIVYTWFPYIPLVFPSRFTKVLLSNFVLIWIEFVVEGFENSLGFVFGRCKILLFSRGSMRNIPICMCSSQDIIFPIFCIGIFILQKFGFKFTKKFYQKIFTMLPGISHPPEPLVLRGTGL